ncbi:MAG: undecaprenyl/decaprenyl-phosphate alpha-N-acetylglucosaminyl 1-phosphate transferase, partial [Actinobacteria bacterium]|nr:undecaprenyl/decaprenyl-phosphate alpha-N-acetylglucosaminyl 1-phosphate transferase [Actinomycetota bacterium]
MREYSLTLFIAATLTYMLTPIVRNFALRFRAVAQVRERDI